MQNRGDHNQWMIESLRTMPSWSDAYVFLSYSGFVCAANGVVSDSCGAFMILL